MSKPVKQLLFIFIFALLFSTESRPLYASTSEKYFMEAKQTSDLNDKIRFLSMALKLKGDFSEALILRAECHFQNNDPGAAEKDLEAFEALGKITARSIVLRGNMAHRNGLLDKAEEFFEKALQTDPKYPEAHFRIAHLFISLGQLKSNPSYYEKALKHFIAVPKGTPFYQFSLIQQAKCQEYFQKYEEAEKAYQSLTSEDATNSVFFFNLGRLQYINNRFEESFKNLDKACDLTFSEKSYTLFYPLFRYAVTVMKSKNSESAQYQLNRFLDSLPNAPEGLLFQNKLSVEDFKKTVFDNERFNALPPGRQKLLRIESTCLKGYYFLMQKETKLALEAFREAATLLSFGSDLASLARFEAERLTLEEEVQ